MVDRLVYSYSPAQVRLERMMARTTNATHGEKGMLLTARRRYLTVLPVAAAAEVTALYG